jgi:hypothetical protein
MTTNPLSPDPISAPLAQGLAGAETALRAFAEGPAQAAADRLADAFDRAGLRIAERFAKTALAGETSIKQLVKQALEDLARLALDRWLPAPAAGQAPAPGGPSRQAAPVTVHLHLPAGTDGPSLVRHEGQIAAALARAVSYGSGKL